MKEEKMIGLIIAKESGFKKARFCDDTKKIVEKEGPTIPHRKLRLTDMVLLKNIDHMVWNSSGDYRLSSVKNILEPALKIGKERGYDYLLLEDANMEALYETLEEPPYWSPKKDWKTKQYKICVAKYYINEK